MIPKKISGIIPDIPPENKIAIKLIRALSPAVRYMQICKAHIFAKPFQRASFGRFCKAAKWSFAAFACHSHPERENSLRIETAAIDINFSFTKASMKVNN